MTTRAPDGGTTIGLVTPSSPGVYVVDTQLDGHTSHTFVHVDGAISGGFTRTYVDRVDGVGGILLTDRGRILLTEFSSVTIYDPDGGLNQRLDLPGNAGIVQVVGNSVWFVKDGAVEHYTDTETGLQQDGRITHSIASSAGAHFTDSREDRAVVASADGIFEFVWTGSEVELAASFPTIPMSSGGVFVDGNSVVDFMFCAVQPGCGSKTCDPVRSCPAETRRVVGMEAGDQLWVINDVSFYPAWSAPAREDLTLQLVSRPASVGNALTPARLVPPSDVWGWGEFVPAYVGLNPHFHVPIPQNGSFYFATVDNVRAVSFRYIVVQEDPFTLRFIPR